MKVTVKGQGDVTLTQQHFVAQGGQASVYIKDSIAYKIYTDPAHAIPEAKFQALSAIQDDHVIKPTSLLLGTRNKPIGYTMQAVSGDPASLCQLFTRPFRDRNQITNQHIIDVLTKLQQHIDHVHKAQILIVDLNELNLLVPKTWDDCYMIDVDSYQTQGFPATVIMPSVRDYSVSSKDFSPLSDWFSYGVLAFQLFIGSHPYKGTHQGSAHIHKDQRLEHRMRHNLSAFRSDVSLPKCCYGFDQIPQHFRDWLKAVLDDGKRAHPPSLTGAAVVITPQVWKTLISSGHLNIQETRDLEGWTLRQYVESGGQQLMLVSQGQETRVLLNNRVLHASVLPGETLVGFTPKLNRPVGLNLHRGVLTFLDFEQKSTEHLGLNAREIGRSGECFYIRTGSKILEVEFSETAAKTVAMASHSVASVMELATRLHEGVAIQSMLGACYCSLFPRSRAGYQVRVPELDDYKIVEAKHDGGVLMAVGARNGQYDRLVFRFDPEYQSYDLRVVDNIVPSGLNFVTLATGVCVTLTEDEKLEVFSAKKGSQGVKVIDDPVVGSDMKLLKVGGKVGFERAGKIYQMSMK